MNVKRSRTQRKSSLDRPAVPTTTGVDLGAVPDHPNAFTRILARARTQLLQPAPLAAAAVLLLAVLGVIVLKHGFGIDLTTKEGLSQAVHAAGMWAMLSFVLILALSVVVSYLPGVPLAAIAGMTWGGLMGGALVVVGGTLGALIAYLIGRYLGASAVAALAGVTIRPREGVGRRSLTILVLVSRLIPLIPFDVVSYAGGVAGLGVRHFLVATVVGMTPSALMLTYVGHILPGAAALAVWLSVASALALLFVPVLKGSRISLDRFLIIDKVLNDTSVET
jgi:uncharacterized membrane protein YdjX (TVP38/TMEM64 family)